MTLTTQDRHPVVADVVMFFDEILADVTAMGTALERLFDAGPVDAAAVLAALEPRARAMLGRDTVFGGGFVAGRDALVDRELYLAWWQGEEQQFLGESDAPATGDPFDYTKREWFRVPGETGRAHLTGPYVDYVCTDEYVVTCTAPVIAGGEMVGVVGADVLAETLEDVLLAPLSAAGATLIGDNGRAMVSSDHRIAPGALIDLAGVTERLPCGELPLSLVFR